VAWASGQDKRQCSKECDHYHGDNYTQAFQAHKKGADKGHLMCAGELSRLIKEGWGCSKDEETGFALEQQAEQQAREKAERAAKTKSNKGAKRGGGRKPPPIAVPKPKPPAVSVAPQAKTAAIAAVQQPLVVNKGPLPSKGSLDAANTPAVAPTSAPVNPAVPTAVAEPKQDTQLKLSAREKGLVRK
jgi:hypothetical protein